MAGPEESRFTSFSGITAEVSEDGERLLLIIKAGDSVLSRAKLILASVGQSPTLLSERPSTSDPLDTLHNLSDMHTQFNDGAGIKDGDTLSGKTIVLVSPAKPTEVPTERQGIDEGSAATPGGYMRTPTVPDGDVRDESDGSPRDASVESDDGHATKVDGDFEVSEEEEDDDHDPEEEAMSIVPDVIESIEGPEPMDESVARTLNKRKRSAFSDTPEDAKQDDGPNHAAERDELYARTHSLSDVMDDLSDDSSPIE